VREHRAFAAAPPRGAGDRDFRPSPPRLCQ
jgi:hypothetical protein